MLIKFTARHYKAPEKLKDYAKAKVQKLKKYSDGIIECEIILDYEKSIQVAEISAKVNHQRLFAMYKSEDVYKSIDFAVEKLLRQLKKHKEKLQSHSSKDSSDLTVPTSIE